MLEYELKKQLDAALQMNKLYEQLIEIYKKDVAARDKVIAAQEALINVYAAKDAATKNFDTSIVPFIFPVWPFGRY